jgi:hypothetical protein
MTVNETTTENNKLGIMWKEAVVACFKGLSLHLSRNGIDHEEPWKLPTATPQRSVSAFLVLV